MKTYKLQIGSQQFKTRILEYSESKIVLTVNDDEFRLGLKPSGFPRDVGNFKQAELLFPEEAAKYLWLRFTDHLNFRR